MHVPQHHSVEYFASTPIAYQFSSSRIKYCAECECLHVGYDHHCSWMSTCIHSANYCYFLWFMVAVEIGLVLQIVSWVVFLLDWEATLKQSLLVLECV